MYNLKWSSPVPLANQYRSAAIQIFPHVRHEDYACLGPYIKNWMEGAASWHPSIIAHRLRASYHSYWWLQIWADALKDLLAVAQTQRSLEGMLKDTLHHLDNEQKVFEPIQRQVAGILDGMVCHTDYEPRAMHNSSLKDLVISGLNPNPGYEADHKDPWNFLIYEEIADRDIIARAKQRGYLDFKYMMYSRGEQSGPLSLSLSLKRQGPVRLHTTTFFSPLFSKFNNISMNKIIVFSFRYLSARHQGYGINCQKVSGISMKTQMLKFT